jgi:hypothetical protein
MVRSAMKRASLVQFGSCVGGISLGVAGISVGGGVISSVGGIVAVSICGVSVGGLTEREQAAVKVRIITTKIRYVDLIFIVYQAP